MTALKYALKKQNMEAIKILVEAEKGQKRCALPVCLLSTQDTGIYNYRLLFAIIYPRLLTSNPRTLGIRNIRRLNMSRGAREGNNAFTKDQSVSLVEDPASSNLEKEIMQWNLPISFVKKVCLMCEKKGSSKITDTQSLIGNVFEAIR